MAATVRSLIDTTPVVEQLPVYSRRTPDPDTISVLSSAPSYRSEAPPYTPPSQPLTHTVSAPERLPAGIPNRRYAPGFTPRSHGSVGDVSNHNYNVASWSSVRTSGAARQYENVAKRRVERGNSVPSLPGTISSPAVPYPVSENAGNPDAFSDSGPDQHGAVSCGQTPPAVPEQPLSPLEDPALVGEAAAKAAKASRLYREKCKRGDEVLRAENRSWDFMLGQMADWEERERSWNKFRDEVSRGRRMKLAKRIGAVQRR
jgi:hypothetical protein